MALGLSEFRWYYGFLGVVLAAAFSIPAWKSYNQFSRGIRADAKVVEFMSQKTKISAGAMVSFRFQDKTGREYTGSDTVYGGWSPPGNNIIRIRYLPEAPGPSAVLDENIKKLPLILFCIGAGIVLLALASELYVRYKRGRFSQGSRSGTEHGSSEFQKNE